MKLKYLLDTNICIYIAKQKPASILKKFEKMEIGELAMSTITFGELLFGAEKSNSSKNSHEKLMELITLIPALPLNTDVPSHYGHIRSNLEKIGKPIGNNDLWIASHARSLAVTLVTNNLKEFKKVPDLKIENWI